MSTFTELYGVNQIQTLRFFLTGLIDLIPAGRNLTQKETIYVAGILSHYAQTSRYESDKMPALANLSEVFDLVLDQAGPTDSQMLETAGAQSLFFAGFFGDQMKRRHNLRFFDSLGSSFYEEAHNHTKDANRKVLFRLMALHFPLWTRCCRDLSRTFRENQFLLNLAKNPEGVRQGGPYGASKEP
ncbi:MAG: hypothetical protein AAB469_01020 [Patescibacteria group bacterium]